VGSLLQGSKGGTLTPAYHASRIFIGGLSGNAKEVGDKNSKYAEGGFTCRLCRRRRQWVVAEVGCKWSGKLNKMMACFGCCHVS
jgi:hypothetical protein